MSRSYRDVLDARGVKRNPCVFEDRTGCRSADDKGEVMPLHRDSDRNAERQDPVEGLGAEHESPGSPKGEIAQNVYHLKDKRA